MVGRAGAAACPLAVQPVHPLAQFLHHPQGLLAEPLDRPGPVQGEGGPHGPATATVGPPQGSGQRAAQPRHLPIQLLLQAEAGVPPVATQLVHQAPQATRGPQPQAGPAGVVRHRLAPAVHHQGGDPRLGAGGHPALAALPALIAPLILPLVAPLVVPLVEQLVEQLAQSAHLPPQGLVLRQQRLHIGGDRPSTRRGSPAAGIKAHRGRATASQHASQDASPQAG